MVMTHDIIDYNFITKQINHWISCPQNGYLGSDYGIDLRQYLQKPISTFDANRIIEKMINDIPILSTLPRNIINIYSTSNDDTVEIFISVGNLSIRAI